MVEAQVQIISAVVEGRMLKLVRWFRKNLFATYFDTALTLSTIGLLYLTVPFVFKWMVLDATFVGDSREACTGGGACWLFVRARFGQFIYGFYPDDEIWRVNATALVFFGGVIPMMFRSFPYKKIFSVFLLTLFPVFAFAMLVGGYFGLEPVETSKFGGLMLTLVIAVVGIVGSLPLGIVLALGRRSQMPVVQKVCVTFIELWLVCKSRHRPRLFELRRHALGFFRVSIAMTMDPKTRFLFWRNVFLMLPKGHVAFEQVMRLLGIYLHFKKQVVFLDTAMKQQIENQSQMPAHMRSVKIPVKPKVAESVVETDKKMG